VTSQTSNKLSGRTALITGGGTGIGAGVARRFVQEGAKVCITGRRKHVLESVVNSLPTGTAAFSVGDVTVMDDVHRMIEAAQDLGGRLDVLVNNAGVTGPTPVAEGDPAAWRRVIETNLFGTFNTMHLAIPMMIAQGGGSIINVASVAALRTVPSVSAYCTSKAAIVHLSRCISSDYASKGVRCNVVCPGLVRTEMAEEQMEFVAKALGTGVDEAIGAMVKYVPVGFAATPADVAGVFAYLASEESRFMTGAVLVIDGGVTAVDAGTGFLSDLFSRAANSQR